MIVSTSNLMEIFIIRYASRDTLSRSVGQLDPKYKYGGYSAYPMQKSTLYKNCQRQNCNSVNCLSSDINILAGDSAIPLISEDKGTDPHWKHLRCTHFAS